MSGNNSASDKELLDLIHIEMHVIRLVAGYSPSVFEQKLNMLISEHFADSCRECKEKAIQLRYKPIEQKKSFLGGIFK